MQSDLPDSVYAFPKQRKEPLTDAQHVRNAVARFDQVIDVSDADCASAFANIEKSANYYDVNLAETSWFDLGIHPQKNRRETAAKGAVTREDVPDVFTQAFVMEKDSKRFPKSGGWGYAVFNYEAASDKFTADPKSLSDCGHACHVAVKAKDYIFHPYQKR
jgi:hypothetical protein